MKPEENGRFWLICILLALGVLAVYGRTLGYDFAAYDDETYVTANPHVQHGPFLDQFTWAFTTDHAGNWHPLTWLSHILDCRLYGLHAGGHHLTNLLLHLANTLLLFSVLRLMTGALWRSAIVAALFAWHPLHVESVAWIAERKDVLSAFFWLLTMWAYARYAQAPTTTPSASSLPQSKIQNPKSKIFYSLALVFFALGLLAKPMVVTLPFALLLLDYWPLRRISNFKFQISNPELRGVVLEKIPFLALAAASCVITYIVQSRGGVVTLATVTPEQRAANILVSYARYLRNMIWPTGLCVHYPFELSWPLWLVAACALFLVSVTIAAVVWHQNRPWLLVGWLWYLGTLVPVIGVVQVGTQSLADRYTYLPLIGIFIALVWGAGEFTARRPEYARVIRRGLAPAALTVCLTFTWFQVPVWRNAETLFTRAVEINPGNYVARINLGVALYYLGRCDEATPHFLAALDIQPGSHLALFDLGRCCEQKGDIAGAIDWFRKAVESRPDFSPARFNLARLLLAQGRSGEAISQFEECLRTTEQPAEVHYSLANALVSQRRFNEAVDHYREALRLNPSLAEAHNNLGMMLVRTSAPEQAVEHFNAAIKLRPNYPEALAGLASILATSPKAELRNGAEAIRLADQAVTLTDGHDPRMLAVFDEACAEAGRFDDAIKAALRTQEVATAARQKVMAEQAAKRLELYRSGKPFHE